MSLYAKNIFIISFTIIAIILSIFIFSYSNSLLFKDVSRSKNLVFAEKYEKEVSDIDGYLY